MKNIDELIAKLESYEDYDGFNDDLVVALREQQAEIARLRDWQPEGNILDLINHAERAEAERDAAIRDAERYRHVRNLMRIGQHGEWIAIPGDAHWAEHIKDQFDAAIDAAMKEKI